MVLLCHGADTAIPALRIRVANSVGVDLDPAFDLLILVLVSNIQIQLYKGIPQSQKSLILPRIGFGKIQKVVKQTKKTIQTKLCLPKGLAINDVGPLSRIFDHPPSPCRFRLENRFM